MCRNFSPEPLADGVLASLAAAALGAPAAGNTAGLDLLALQGDRTSLYWDTTLAGARRDGFRWPGLLVAPLLIIPYVCPGEYLARYAETDKRASGLGGREQSWPVPYWFVDGGAAVMAMLLVAQDAGLGAAFFGQFDHEAAVREALGVPPGRRALGTVAVGHRASTDAPSRSARRGRPSPADHLHLGTW